MKYRAFTLVDLVGSLVIVTLVAGLVFPTIQAARETARRTACLDKMRNVGLAMREYHNVHKTLPGHRIGPGADNRISAFTFLLPQLGHQALYDEIVAQKWQDPWRLEKVDSNGRSIRNTTSPYCTTISEILCPEDTAFLSKNERETAYTNYVVSHGDWITGQNEPFTRGPFVPGKKRRFEDIPDGRTKNGYAQTEN